MRAASSPKGSVSEGRVLEVASELGEGCPVVGEGGGVGRWPRCVMPRRHHVFTLESHARQQARAPTRAGMCGAKTSRLRWNCRRCIASPTRKTRQLCPLPDRWGVVRGVGDHHFQSQVTERGCFGAPGRRHGAPRHCARDGYVKRAPSLGEGGCWLPLQAQTRSVSSIKLECKEKRAAVETEYTWSPLIDPARRAWHSLLRAVPSLSGAGVVL